MNILKRTIDFLLFSNLFIGGCAVALTFTNELTTGGEIHFDSSYWFVLFSTVFVYSALKFRVSEEPVVATAHRVWASKHQQLSRNILLISLIGTAAFFFQLNRNVQWTVVLLGLVTAFYGFIEIPFTKPKKKLRNFGLAKTVFVAVVWSVTTVIVPLGETFVAPDMLTFLLLRRFLFILGLTMVFEIKDMKADREHRLNTLPYAIGVQNTKLLAQGIFVLLIIMNLVQYFFFDIALSNMLAVNLSILVSILCTQPVDEETGERWYYFVLDGMMIVQFVFVYLASRWF